MIIYPAIDLRGGQCVRLYQGDYKRETIYNNDPYAMVDSFVSQGAGWIHIVDLDGAKDPQRNQSALISELVNSCKVNIQTGGGIRDKQQVQDLLSKGAARVIIGSMAISNSEQVMAWFQDFGPERLVLALDIMFDDETQQPMVVVNAWQKKTEILLSQLVEQYHSVGVIHLLCTDISRDGTLQGSNTTLYQSLQQAYPFLKIQASGGVHSISDLQELKREKIAGAVVGRALYENKFTLTEALTC